jgi:hypothetical protein
MTSQRLVSALSVLWPVVVSLPMHQLRRIHIPWKRYAIRIVSGPFPERE